MPKGQMQPKPEDEPGECPVCRSPRTTMPYRPGRYGYLMVYCFECRGERRVGC